MADEIPGETLKEAMYTVGRGEDPQDLQNALRMIYHEYAEINAFLAKNAAGVQCMRQYKLRLTRLGHDILEVAHE